MSSVPCQRPISSILSWDATQCKQRGTSDSHVRQSARRNFTNVKASFLQLNVDSSFTSSTWRMNFTEYASKCNQSKNQQQKYETVWNSNAYEPWGLHKYCKLTTSYYDFLKFTSHTYLIKTRYIAISTDNTKCTFCTKFECFQLFQHLTAANTLHNAWTGDVDVASTSLAGLLHECEFRSH